MTTHAQDLDVRPRITVPAMPGPGEHSAPRGARAVFRITRTGDPLTERIYRLYPREPGREPGAGAFPWEISVRPDGPGTIRLSIPSDQPCGQTGAVCAGGNLRLSNEPVARILGPDRPPQGNPIVLGNTRVGETLSVDTSRISDPDGLENATFTHQWVRITSDGPAEITGGTGDSYTLQQEDGGNQVKVITSFTDDGGSSNMLYSAAQYISFQPLTASFSDLPTAHDGSAAFTIRVLFSEDVDIEAGDLTGHALRVTGGSATGAQKVYRRADLWELTIEPSGNGTVGIQIWTDRSCGRNGAICTADDRPLTSRIGTSIPGP